MAEMGEQATAGDVGATGSFLEGTTHQAIAAYAAEHRPDIVVLTHRGACSVFDSFSETVMDRLLARLACPAVLVRG